LRLLATRRVAFRAAACLTSNSSYRGRRSPITEQLLPRAAARNCGRRIEGCACLVGDAQECGRRWRKAYPPYFLPVGFLAVGDVWLVDACVGLAVPVLGLWPVVAGLGVPFQGSMSLLQSDASDNRRQIAGATSIGVVNFSLTFDPIAGAAAVRVAAEP
jgi:hypothetical protein